MVSGVHGTTSQVPQQPGVYSAEAQTPLVQQRLCCLNVFHHPAGF